MIPSCFASYGNNSSTERGRKTWSTSVLSLVAIPSAMSLLVGCSSSPTEPDELMTVTLVRHGESAGNSSGLIDTSLPGPSLTDLGRAQAQAAAERLADDPFDSVYASTMYRTQETAEPTAELHDKTIQILPGIREIPAGDWEGTSEHDLFDTYMAAPLEWISGDRSARIPGSLTGDEFQEQFGSALETVEKNGDRHPVIFAHAGSIMTWTLMNTDGDKSLFTDDTLGNAGHIVVTGSPTTGWELVEWEAQPADFPTAATTSEPAE